MAIVFKLNSVAKVLSQINELNDKKEILDSLKVNGHPVLISILKYIFDPSIKFLLPEGVPPYKPNMYDEPKALLGEANKMYLFIEGGHKTLKQIKREQIFIQMLETVSPEDAILLLSMKDKKCPYKNITKAIVKEAFPGLIVENEQVK
jgi:hypothetical protein